MNKYKINKIYSFDELPKKIQNDIIIPFEDDREFNPYDYLFYLRKISYQELLEEYDEVFGANLIEEMEDDYIVELAEDIEVNGLLYPPVGSEGNHRALAHLYLGRDMLRFEIIKKNYYKKY